jgi:V/A-type H+-transporting ATPase subunit D
MELRVNPTRMEMNRLKKRLVMAQRGHKLLKEKRDGLIGQFVTRVRRTKELREKMETELAGAFARFLLARALMPASTVEEALLFPAMQAEIDVKTQNLMSVKTPLLKLEYRETTEGGKNIYPYGFAGTSAELDASLEALVKLLPLLVELAELEKTVTLLAEEIEKTRRRVNALEYVMIPKMQETVRYISMKLDENERGALTRLMKIKDIVRAKT